MFDAERVTHEIIQWIRDWFDENGKGCKAVVAISGGADSSIVAALCVEALGQDNVVGVLMPDGEQKDLQDAIDLAEHLGIVYMVVNIHEAVNAFNNIVGQFFNFNLTQQSTTNVPPRVRMIVARMIAQNINGRYINTCNLTEDYLGYFTIDGDGTGDCGPLRDLVKTQVKMVGRLLLPERFTDKTPHAGLTAKSDEDDFGFTYDVVDKYILTGTIEDMDVKEKIDRMHEQNKFKMQPMPYYKLK